MAAENRDKLRKLPIPENIRAQTATPLQPSDAEEDTDVGGDRDTRIERRVVNTDRSTRAAFAAIKELKDDFRQHSADDKEALDAIREKVDETNTILTDLRLVVATSVTEQRADRLLRQEEREIVKLQAAARGEVQKIQAGGELDTKKIQLEHTSKWKLQLLGGFIALAIAITSALLTAHFK